MEIRSTLLDQRLIDAREDAARGRAFLFAQGLLDQLKTQHALDALDDQKRERAIELVTELCGLLDGVGERVHA